MKEYFATVCFTDIDTKQTRVITFSVLANNKQEALFWAGNDFGKAEYWKEVDINFPIEILNIRRVKL